MRYPSLLIAFYGAIAIGQDHYLVINPDGHKSLVYDTDIDAGGNLVTGSFDKTVKVWDLDHGYITREFLGQIGPGSEGMVYTLDVSPDNNYLAVAGWMGKDDESEDLGPIRIYDYQTGTLKKLLKFHEDAVKTVRFTDDSKHLVSGDASGFVVLWDHQRGMPVRLFERQSDGLSNLDTHNDYFVTTHEDGMVYRWDYEKTKPTKKINFFTKVKDLVITPEVTIAGNGKYIALSGKEVGMILIYDDGFSLQDYFFTGENEVVDMAFSPEADRLVVGLKDPGKNRAVVYELQGKKWIEIASFNKHDDLVNCVEFVDRETCISSGGRRNEIAVWQIASNGQVKEIQRLSGKGTALYSASMDHHMLAFTRDPQKAYGFAPYTEVFDLFARQLVTPLPELSAFHYPVIEKNGWSMHEKPVVRRNELDPSEMLYLVRNQTITDSIPRYPWEGNRHDAYCFIGDAFLVTGGSYGILEAYDYKASLRSRFVGHEGDIRSVTTSSDERFMITSSTDMTIRIWPIDQVGQEPDSVNFIYPVASLFIGENREWVIWNNDGYFTSSRKGAKYVGYHVNQGKNKAARFYPFDQFDVKYNRPDIILRDLGIADEGTIELYERAYYKRLKRLGISEEDLQTDIHAPVLTLKKFTQNGSVLQLDVSAFDDKYALDRLHVLINDVPIYGLRGLPIAQKNARAIEQTLSVELMSGENKVQVSVLNNKGVESLRETVFITNTATATGDLYLVALGVSNYKDPKFNLAYAAKDAQDMADAFEGNTVYETVHQKILLDDQVTLEHILELKTFLSSAKTNDVVMLFIAGHGVLDSELDYYYCTYDTDFQNPGLRGISYAGLEELFDGIRALRKLLIMDTCHSGELDKDDIEVVENIPAETGDVVFRGTDALTTVRERHGLRQTSEAVKEMFNDLNRGTGTTVISSAGGVEFAMESAEWKNGLFTWCFLQGIRSGKADLNQDGRIFVSEMRQYVRSAVSERSAGKQMPASRFENISLDYALW